MTQDRTEVHSIEEMVAGGTNDLRALAEKGNRYAKEWLPKVEAAATPNAALFQFGEMKVSLLRERMYGGADPALAEAYDTMFGD